MRRILMRPLLIADFEQWREVRNRNADWLTKWEPQRPANSPDIVNDRNVTLNADGTFTVHFGSEADCGAQANRVDIEDGWNFLMRVYRPGAAVLERTYKLPEVAKVAR